MVNEWTRNDLPDHVVIRDVDYMHGDGTRSRVIDLTLDAVVEHLNAHHPKPDGDLHSTVLRQAGHVHDLIADLADMERERDEWKARAEAAEARIKATERERDDWRDKAYSASEGMRKATARAEAAEARTTPAVTKRELRSVVGAHDPGDDELAVSRVNALTDRLWSLVSGADPAVHVVRESELPEVENKGDGGWDSGGQWYPSYATTEIIRENIARSARNLVNDLAVARAIEAGQAVDPLLDKAQEFAALADWELTDREAGLLHTVARHVLGQEASDGR